MPRQPNTSSAMRRPSGSAFPSDAYLASIIASAMDAIITVDEQYRIVVFNAAAERMFGCPASEALGAPIDRFIPERFRPQHREYLQRFGESGETIRRMGKLGQIVGLRADGTEFPLESAISCVEVEGWKFYTVIHRDITDRVQAEQRLAKERAFASAILDTAGVLIVVLDREGRIVRFNRACERATGYRFDEVHGRRVWDLFVAPEEIAFVKAVFDELRSGRYPNEHENDWLTKEGGRRAIAWSDTALVDDSGAVEYVIGIGLDVTEQQKARTLQASETAILTLLHTGASLNDVLERICLCVEDQSDGSLCAILAYARDALNVQAAPSLPGPLVEAVRNVAKDVASSPYGDVVLGHVRAMAMNQGKDPRWEPFHEAAARFGLQAWWAIPILSPARGDCLGVVSVFHREARAPQLDETYLLDLASHLAGLAFERQHDQEALQRSHDALKALTARLLTAQDDERRRLSRELHDDLNQRLAVLALTMQAAQQKMAPSDPAYAVLHECYEAIANLSEDIRRLAYQLHPSILDDLGLEAALRAFVDDCARREGLNIVFMAEQVLRNLSKDVAACLYRIGQESLRNVAKHAHASHVTVALAGSEGGVSLIIVDDGVGFYPDQIRATRRGLGLIGMQERIRLVDGRLTIHSQPGKGTKVSAWVPIRPSS
ncbi:MAG: PAS domain S-box protein [Nitrospirae bacterium]|nr:MAG: PAS domain S-box protein [Nitrospirota bacterium]